MYTLQSIDGEARAGVLTTPHGKAETPFFMPVATKGTVKYVSPQELIEMSNKAIIANALVLELTAGSAFIKEAGGIHKLINYPHTIFTDSGGFQMGSDRLFVGINDKGVLFRDPGTSKQIKLGPRDVMEIESDIGSDVAMCLDHMPPVLNERAYIEDAIRRTHIWAKICKAHHDKLNDERGTKQLLFGIAQGGTHKDLREKSARFINGIDFDGIALGGLCIGETMDAMYNAINVQVPLLDENKPRYLMGVGTPVELIEAIARGVDCFDSKFPTQNARHGNLFTYRGKIKIDKTFEKDFGPIDPDCACYVCKDFSRAFIYHLFKSGEKTFYRYTSYHNTYFLQKLMQDTRKAISEGRFKQFKVEFLSKYSNGG